MIYIPPQAPVYRSSIPIQYQTPSKRTHIQLISRFILIDFVVEMFDNNKNAELPALNTHEPDWVNIDLEPRNVDPETHRANATVIDQGPGWTSYDLEAQFRPKNRWWHYGKKTKIVVGIAIVAMVVVGIAVPMVVMINERHSEGIQ